MPFPELPEQGDLPEGVYFQHLPAQLRVTASPEEFPLVADGYCQEIIRMQDEVLEY